MTDSILQPPRLTPDYEQDLQLAMVARDANQAIVKRLLAFAALIAILLLPACAASPPVTKPAAGLQANPAEQTDDGSPSIPEPELNPSPKHVIRIFGRAPKNLDFYFRAVWEVGKREKGCLVDLPFWEGGGDRTHGIDIPIRRRGESYEAELVIDRYLAGHCQWRFSAVGIIVERPGRPKERDMRSVISGKYMFDDENKPQCQPHMKNCDEARNILLANAKDISVQVRCGTAPPGREISKDNPFKCDWMFDPHHKKYHLVKPHTRRIQIDAYDLDVELPPAPEQHTRKNAR